MINESMPSKLKSFWQKLWLPEPTPTQVALDFVAGVIALLLGLVFDPFVFRGEPCFGNDLSGYSVLAYVAIGGLYWGGKAQAVTEHLSSHLPPEAGLARRIDGDRI